MREAIVTLSDSELEALGFGELVAEVRAAGIRDLRMLEDEGYTCVPQVEVEERLDHDLLETLDCIDRWELVAEREHTYLYLLELTATGLPEEIADDYEEVVGTSAPEVSDRGLLLSFVGSQEAIRDVLRHYVAAGASPGLRRLAAYEGDGTSVDALTERQLEVVRTAYDLGFYEIPREASTEDVATELGVDPATVSEHLQRAERNLLAEALPG